MGNLCIKERVEPFVDLGWETWKELMQTFNFSEDEFFELYRPFDSLRIGNCEKVAISTLASYYNFAEDGHLIRCFSLFDKLSSGLVDFGQFFLCLWNYCTHSLETHLMFSYLIYDKEFSGRLTVGAVKRFLLEAYDSAEHSEAEHWNAIEVLIVGDGLGDTGIMDYEDFALMISTHYELFAWAFRLRSSFVAYFFDDLFWAKKQSERIVLMIDTGNEIPLSTNSVLQFKAKGKRNFELILEWAKSIAKAAQKKMNAKLSKLRSVEYIKGQPYVPIASSYARKKSFDDLAYEDNDVLSSDRVSGGIRRLHSVSEENSVMLKSEKTTAR